MSTPVPIVSIAPIVLPVPGRAVDLQIRVTAPSTGDRLPIILLAHGIGSSNNLSSLNGYAPLANHWAREGFVVIQPTHLDSRTFGLSPDDPQIKRAWHTRAEDMTAILDRLDEIGDAVPHLRDRMDRAKVAVAGHSMGGHTAGLLLGLRLKDPQGGGEVDLADSRITAGVVLAAPGRGDVLTDFAADRLSFMKTSDFSEMRTPAIVVVGDEDKSELLSTAGPEWLMDSYRLAPGPKSLLTLFGAGHILGGITGYDAAETTDENPARVAAIATLTAAYLKTQFGVDPDAWGAAQKALADAPAPLGKVESK
jgi:dienelactone hydrolase